jgi:hypothetical protein
MHESITDETRRTLQRQLAGDVQTQTFGSGTANLVSIYQEQLKNRHDVPKDIKNALPVNGDVGPATADALNWDLRSLGALPKPKPKPKPPNK